MELDPKHILLSPVSITFLAFVSSAYLQLTLIYPTEAKLFPVYSMTASLMFLPHAVRVLATGILGPRAFFVLLPAMAASELLRTRSFAETFGGTSILFLVIGAACAPTGYILLKRIIGDRFVFSELMLNWRYVFLTGIIASAINSIGLVSVLVMPAEAVVVIQMLLRFFVGDIFGLFVGLVILTYVFRILRNVKTA